MNPRVLSHLTLLLATLLLWVGLAAAIALPSPRVPAETAYVACVGVGAPADMGMCVPPPYPERLPLPD